MTPYQIQILIHHHASPDRFERDTAPAYAGVVKAFMEDGILAVQDDGSIRTTDRGDALLKMICATPYPEKVWVDPRDADQRGGV